jgi:hypothetical protein
MNYLLLFSRVAISQFRSHTHYAEVECQQQYKPAHRHLANKMGRPRLERDNSPMVEDAVSGDRSVEVWHKEAQSAQAQRNNYQPHFGWIFGSNRDQFLAGFVEFFHGYDIPASF